MQRASGTDGEEQESGQMNIHFSCTYILGFQAAFKGVSHVITESMSCASDTGFSDPYFGFRLVADCFKSVALSHSPSGCHGEYNEIL